MMRASPTRRRSRPGRFASLVDRRLSARTVSRAVGITLDGINVVRYA
jgi:hypothetical protein